MAKKSVGLIIFTEVPRMGLVAVLRERGLYKFKEWEAESWPGIYQVTVHGKLEAGETFLEALRREMVEELGQRFADVSEALSQTRSGTTMHLVWSSDDIETRAQKVHRSYIKTMRLSPDGGGLRFLTFGEIGNIQDAIGLRISGVSDRSVVAMFPDEKIALVSAFEKFMK
jgi:ADP-ribose pyrophosphatase YjhB (NUDIX family)